MQNFRGNIIYPPDEERDMDDLTDDAQDDLNTSEDTLTDKTLENYD